MAEPEELAKMQEKKFMRYKRLLVEEAKGIKDMKFFDAVVITASDEEQAKIYEEQLQWRKQLKSIPSRPHYHVLHDPPGVKIGNGGATFVALDFLRDKFSSEFESLRVLLIHAGGYSQRTPQHSVCGKIFAALPAGPFQGCSMLEMCFAMLCDIPGSAPPGVMLKCGDDIIIFDSDVCDFNQPGFTALAHRSTVDIAYTHGVFCLEASEGSQGEGAGTVRCRRYTHKPSHERMRKYGALMNKELEAYTDSTFFFDMPTAKRLLTWWDEHERHVGCEVDAYGDLLQALGPEADEEYIGKGSDLLSETRRSLFQALNGMELNVCKVEKSRFWHIGTIPEMLDHFCGSTSFLVEASGGSVRQEGFAVEIGAHGLGYYSKSLTSCKICSRVHESAELGPRSVVEFCTVGKDVKIGRDCLLSCVALTDGVVIPDGIFLQTVVITLDGRTRYVTQVMRTSDDVKQSGTIEKLLWLGMSMSKVCSVLGIAEDTIHTAQAAGKPKTFWDARLHPVAESRELSVLYSLSLMYKALGIDTDQPLKDVLPEAVSAHRVSMGECVRCKHAVEQLRYRRMFDDLVEAASEA
mmetsp:Transcript_20935/g.69896  ORF Transcript_20935/g.69896 Transcript_20935/m.69896 type:complete len:578 (-) Transcript_20935:37-1770(-)